MIGEPETPGKVWKSQNLVITVERVRKGTYNQGEIKRL